MGSTVTMDIIINSHSRVYRVIKGEEGGVVVSGCCGSVAVGGLSQKPWVRLPAAPPFFLSLCRFKVYGQ